MALTVRTADKVAQSLVRPIPGGIGTAAPTSTNQWVAHGISGSDDCILSIGIDGAVVGNTTISLWVWSPIMKQWLLFGASAAVYQKSFVPGSVDAFVIPESTSFFLQGSQALSAGQIYVNGQPFNNNALGGVGGQP